MTGSQLIATARKIQAVEGTGFRTAKLKAAQLFNALEAPSSTDQSSAEGDKNRGS